MEGPPWMEKMFFSVNKEQIFSYCCVRSYSSLPRSPSCQLQYHSTEIISYSICVARKAVMLQLFFLIIIIFFLYIFEYPMTTT